MRNLPFTTRKWPEHEQAERRRDRGDEEEYQEFNERHKLIFPNCSNSNAADIDFFYSIFHERFVLCNKRLRNSAHSPKIFSIHPYTNRIVKEE